MNTDFNEIFYVFSKTEYLALNDKILDFYTHLFWSVLACSFYNTKSTRKGSWVCRILHCSFQKWIGKKLPEDENILAG